MKTVTLNLSSFAFIVVTRAALGAGIGLLLASRLSEARRRGIGTTLATIGAVTTIPAALLTITHVKRTRRKQAVDSRVERDARLIGATRFPRKGDDGDEDE